MTSAVMVLASCSAFGTSEPPGNAADASTVNDAGLEADAPSAAPFCPRQGSLICEDFEGPSGFRFTTWRKDDEQGRNTIEVEPVTDAPSSTHALRLAAVRGADAATDAYIASTTPNAVSKMTLEASIRLGATGTRAVLLEAEDGPDTVAVRLKSSGELEERLDGDGGVHTNTLGYVALPRVSDWMRVVLFIDLDARRGSMRVGGETKEFSLSSAWTPRRMEARFGLIDASTEADWVAYLDDLIVTQ